MRILRPDEFQLDRRIDTENEEQQAAARTIVERVRAEGDKAVLEFTAAFDKAELTADRLRVTAEELQEAYASVDEPFLDAIRSAAANIRAYHEKQLKQSWIDVQPNGTTLGQIVRPLSRVGVYVPGGKAAYPSSVLMNIIPASVAGVKEIVMVTPPATGGTEGIDPYILVAAAEAGVSEVYRVGGAQAIAALAYGTETIPRVDKIVGPGNIYVALAKRLVYGVVDIDSIAGPSEIVVVADEGANAAFIAADLLSQAEHDEMASAVLLTPSRALAEAVQAEVERQLDALPRRAIAAESVRRHGAILLTASLEEAIAISNRLAPEHLELMVADPLAWLGRIENAGAIFLGPYSAESVGDYYAGPNHVLPTNGTARFFSPLGVDTFLKRSSLIAYSREALLEGAERIMTLARREGLEGHARAIQVRLDAERR
ncbi:histidinol dehydrogenase [Paenibacillus sp.]|uniref:histidinol dehydrogenase n=1 Tax=Paenibacillus sp. TaxID=58172 RepID=UPI002D2EFF35|nr:histidinol dehydrogenase [Paenibacillus sp.]HZG86945.1 histidinol dehydrogenase [Paenibacillus sp.]